MAFITPSTRLMSFAPARRTNWPREGADRRLPVDGVEQRLEAMAGVRELPKVDVQRVLARGPRDANEPPKVLGHDLGRGVRLRPLAQVLRLDGVANLVEVVEERGVREELADEHGVVLDLIREERGNLVEQALDGAVARRSATAARPRRARTGGRRRQPPSRPAHERAPSPSPRRKSAGRDATWRSPRRDRALRRAVRSPPARAGCRPPSRFCPWRLGDHLPVLEVVAACDC